MRNQRTKITNSTKNGSEKRDNWSLGKLKLDRSHVEHSRVVMDGGE